MRHAVAGNPIVHSLSPVLTALVHIHLSKQEDVDPRFERCSNSTDGVENALAWVMLMVSRLHLIGSTGSPLGKFRANTF